MPGPRLVVSWLVWLWLAMYVALIFQVAGMVGGLASIFSLAGLPMPLGVLAVLVGASCAVLLVVGRYRFVDVSTGLVAVFTACHPRQRGGGRPSVHTAGGCRRPQRRRAWFHRYRACRTTCAAQPPGSTPRGPSARW